LKKKQKKKYSDIVEHSKNNKLNTPIKIAVEYSPQPFLLF
jgi:hypothetical protein